MSLNSKFQHFKSYLYSKDTDRKILFFKLKTEYSFEEQQYIISKLPKIFLSLVYKHPYAKKNQDLGKGSKSYVKSYDTEMNWLILLFVKYSNDINNFIKLKTKFETNILLGHYSVAENVLNSIKKTSFSYWGLENRFLLIQLQKGLKHNYELKNSSRNRKDVSPEYFFLNHFFSYKVEDDVSFFSYEKSLELSLQDMAPIYQEYMQYRLNPSSYNFEVIEKLLYITSNFSILDKYILFRDLIYSLTISDSEIKNLDNIHIDELQLEISDPLVQKSLSFKKSISLSNSGLYEVEYLSIIDSYTLGNYQSVITKGKVFINQTPSCFNILELYIKSHIYLEKDTEKITEFDSTINKILILSDTIIRKKENSNDSLIELLTISNSISSFDISHQLLSFIATNHNEELLNLSLKKDFIYSKFNDPLSFSIFNNQNQYLSSFQDNITAKFFRQINDREFSEIRNDIPSYRTNFQIAKRHYIDENFEDCYKILEKLIPEIKSVDYQYEFLLIYLFDSYVFTKQHDKAINLFVETFLNKPQLTKRIKTSELGNSLLKLKWKGVTHNNINFPIFMYLIDLETHTKFIAYDLYMRTTKENLPSNLYKNLDRENTSSDVYFLKNVCNEKIISKKAVVFKNSSDVVKERIAICQILLKIDDNNIKEYNDEISEITQILTVKQRVKEVDESKIYVDEEGILNSELEDVKKSFNRYKKITQLLNKSEINSKSLSLESLIFLLNNSSKNVRESDLQLDLFRDLYLSIRNKFLFSNKYGLEYYISQRIRHGTIIGQIRKQFKEFNLVTTKSSKSNEYLPNKYWLDYFNHLNSKQKKDLDTRLNKFSIAIDYVINELKDGYIQIKTEDKKSAQKGWFDFAHSVDKNEMILIEYYSFRDIDDFEGFVRHMFDVLWRRTEFNLQNIRAKISGVIKKVIVSELDKLEKDLKDIIPVGKYNNKIYRNIADCRTKAQDDLEYVSRWFNKSKNYAIDFTFDDAFATSLQIVNNIISPSNFEIRKESDVNCTINGYYFTHFVDLIKIFLTNINDYNKENNLNNKLSFVEINENSKILTINFSNKLSENENFDSLKDKIDERTEKLESSNYIQTRKEGKSGFYKANNIIKNVFRNNNNKIIFKLTKEDFSVKCLISLKNLTV